MLNKQFLFVEHSKGTFEGTAYDNVLLSDGLTTGKFKNETGQEKLDFQRGDKVDCEFEVQFGNKNKTTLVLKSII